MSITRYNLKPFTIEDHTFVWEPRGCLWCLGDLAPSAALLLRPRWKSFLPNVGLGISRNFYSACTFFSSIHFRNLWLTKISRTDQCYIRRRQILSCQLLQLLLLFAFSNLQMWMASRKITFLKFPLKNPFGYFGHSIQNGLYGQKLFKMVQNCPKYPMVKNGFLHRKFQKCTFLSDMYFLGPIKLMPIVIHSRCKISFNSKFAGLF